MSIDTPSRKTRILKILRNDLIPAMQNDARQIIYARRQLKEKLPPGVLMSKAGKLGRGKSVRGRGMYEQSVIMTQWPDLGQEALHIPIISCVVRGELQLRMGEYYLTLPAGHILITPPGMPHPIGGSVYDKPNELCDVLMVSPRGRQMHCWVTEHRQAGRPGSKRIPKEPLRSTPQLITAARATPSASATCTTVH